MMYRYKTRGTCSVYIDLEIEDGMIKDVVFHGGCDGNLKGISKLVKGMSAEEAMKRLEGIDCNGRGTSCPDQLSNAIRLTIAQMQSEDAAESGGGEQSGCISSDGSEGNRK